MKKFVSGLILAVVVTPALAEDNVNQLGITPPMVNGSSYRMEPMVKTSSYRMEVKEGEEILSTLKFAAIDSEMAKVQNWNVQSHAFDDSNPSEVYKVKTGFSITLSPVINSKNFFRISFDYSQPVNQNKPKQSIYSFETGVFLAKGDVYCTDLSGTGEKVEFCLSRN
ncbi:hypothetical protein [Vibrio harveyi]|uniref:hypothetical protein n=1 Tax=Vibrio harveyi TaxID=669 RepID=UPI00247FD33F|nr:hypothetical protein [Vibrio harveyi]